MNDAARLMPATATTREWWRGAVIYQIYPRSFADSNGDGIGDLPGITAHLDHVASLGVDGIWLSPFFTSPMLDFGYDVADYCGVDPIFGTLADFDALVARAHALGLKVLIDQVYSHSSDRHPWFQESRADRVNAKADWYVWADAKPDGSPPNNWQSVFGGPAWTWDARRGQYYMHNFLSEQPQLHVHYPRCRTPCSASRNSGSIAGRRVPHRRDQLRDARPKAGRQSARAAWQAHAVVRLPAPHPQHRASPKSRYSSNGSARWPIAMAQLSRWRRSAGRTRKRRCTRLPRATDGSIRRTASTSSMRTS